MYRAQLSLCENWILENKIPMRGPHAFYPGDAGVCLWAVHGATELRVFTVVAFCAAWNGGLGLSRCLGPGECLLLLGGVF